MRGQADWGRLTAKSCSAAGQRLQHEQQQGLLSSAHAAVITTGATCQTHLDVKLAPLCMRFNSGGKTQDQDAAFLGVVSCTP